MRLAEYMRGAHHAFIENQGSSTDNAVERLDFAGNEVVAGLDLDPGGRNSLLFHGLHNETGLSGQPYAPVLAVAVRASKAVWRMA